MTSEFFKNTVQWNVEKNGTRVSLPYFYYDNLFMTAIYTASTARVRQLIPHPDLHPIEWNPGRCLVAFTAFEYRKIDDLPYNEVSIAFPILYKEQPIPLLSAVRSLTSSVYNVYVWQLPVTTESARAGGVDLFFYPKFIADIRFLKTTDRITCVLSESGSEILRITGRVILTKRGQVQRYKSFTVDQDTLLSVNTLVNPIEFASSFRRGDVSVEIGKLHPLSQALNELELARHPFSYQFSPSNELILFPAHNVRDV
jgi:hypothetical protein